MPDLLGDPTGLLLPSRRLPTGSGRHVVHFWPEMLFCDRNLSAFSVYFQEKYQQIMPSHSHVRDWFIMQWNVSSLLYICTVIFWHSDTLLFLRIFGTAQSLLYLPSHVPSHPLSHSQAHFGTFKPWKHVSDSGKQPVHSFNCSTMHLWLHKFIQRSIFV